ncbi:transposase, partial [Corynebacterium striatum]
KQLLFNRINLGLISRVSSCHSSHSGPSPHAGWEPTHKPSDTLDHGSVYTSQAFRDHCAQLGVRQSMGAVGTSADNALAESFNATLKREVLRDRKVFDNPIICRQEVFRWCMRYNTRRRHSWCNLLAPDTFEALNSATLTQAA